MMMRLQIYNLRPVIAVEIYMIFIEFTNNQCNENYEICNTDDL